MPSLRQIRRRIRSVKGTAQITKAMELVATSKMRRSQMTVQAARPYAEKIRNVIADLAPQPGSYEEQAPHPLLERRDEINRIGLILITSDRGLAGGLNANVTRLATNFILGQTAPVIITAVGRKGRDWVLRFGRDLRAEFLGLGEHASFLQTVPVARVAIDDYISGFVDQVVLVYPSFVSTLSQRPTVETLLPVEPLATAVPRRAEFIYEPSSAAVLSKLLPRFVETKVYEALLETVASEHAARMMAMRSATENANEIIHDLSLSYNQARQATITRELIEIVSGAEIGAR